MSDFLMSDLVENLIFLINQKFKSKSAIILSFAVLSVAAKIAVSSFASEINRSTFFAF